jgi:hypothetical protein
MKYRKLLWALAALNAALLLALVWKLGGETPAAAQMVRARGEMLMVPADVPVMQNGVVYMIDTQNGVLAGFSFDQNARQFVIMQPLDLNRIFAAAVGGGR